jgi:hypothetical protein
MLGAQAPSPALSAKRERILRFMLKTALSSRGAGAGARPPSNNGLVSNAGDFVGKSVAVFAILPKLNPVGLKLWRQTVSWPSILPPRCLLDLLA